MKFLILIKSLTFGFCFIYSPISLADNTSNQNKNYSNSLQDLINKNGTSKIESAIISYDRAPRNLQFFARDSQDSASVTFAGKVSATGYDSIYLEVYKNNVLWKRKSSLLNYIVGISAFSLTRKIHAELSEFKFKLYLKSGLTGTLMKTVDSVVCGDAYIICGQSNSNLSSPYATFSNEFYRTFGIQTSNYNADPYNAADTNWALSNADLLYSYLSGTPNVGVWGLQLQKLIEENFGIPTCIINGGRYSSTIQDNLRNNLNQTDLSSIYGKTLYRVIKSGLANNIKAIFWYQGESDGGISWLNYFTNFGILYSSWKENYTNFKKIFLFQTRPCCSDVYASQLREVQRKLPQTFLDIELLSTAGMPFFEACHYQYWGYLELANMVFRPLSKHFYSTSDTINMRPPNIKAAYYTNAQKNEIALLFDNSRVAAWPADTLGQSMKNYIYLNGVYGNISYGSVSGDTVKLRLINPSNATKITYLPPVFSADSVVYEGPFMRNPIRLGALSFHDYPISNYPPTTLNITLAIEGYYNTSTSKLNIRDTITAVLRNNYYPYQIKDSARAVIDSISLTGRFVFVNNISGTYYTVIKGRNCLETWSKSVGIPITTGGTFSYNFTTSSSQAYGNNMRLKGTKYCIYSADINQDGIIDGSDLSSIGNDAYNTLTGNVRTDVNGDRFVDGSDFVIGDINAFITISKITP